MAIKKKRSFNFYRIVRIVFILFLAFLLVYVYYLYTKGLLMNKFLNISTNLTSLIKHNPDYVIGIGSYILVFYLGFFFGKRKK